ncbi:MAG: hypothetical protein AB7U46_05955 [Paenirhodobacter sp.]|uniref:hypothetical protein n=1 Tax=Paenirhodobacter sp. TaxID=1965326 RepID=UPI003D0DE2E5
MFRPIARFTPILCAVLAAAAAQAETAAEPAVPPGIYAMFQDDGDAADRATPEFVRRLSRECGNMPVVAYADGLIVGHKPNTIEAAQAGGPIYPVRGTLRCTQAGPDEFDCEAREGAAGSDAAPHRTERFSRAILVGGAVRLVRPGTASPLLFLPCTPSNFDREGPGGRNIFDDLVARDDGGPALPRP